MRAATMVTALIDPEEADGEEELPERPNPGTERGKASGQMNKPRILLVEDEFLVGMEVEEGLTRAGYELVGIAVTAEDAVRWAAAERPRLVVMDIRLIGRRDGIDAALEIFTRQGIRSIFASAHVDNEVKTRAEAARPLGWIAKPYRVEALAAAVAQALRELDEEG